MHLGSLRMLCRYVLALLTCMSMCSLWAQSSSEAALKAAYLFNFALYTEFPSVGLAFELCVVGKDTLGDALDALGRKEVGGRSVRVRHVSATADLASECNMVFVPAGEAASLSRVTSALAGLPVLTVAEGDATRQAKVLLRMTTESGRLVFDADNSAALAVGLRMSSKMLRLARSIQ
jgi:hypothetical protein